MEIKTQAKYKPPDLILQDYYKTDSLTPKDGICKFGFIVTYYIAEMFNFT